MATDSGFPSHYINRLLDQAKETRLENELSLDKIIYCTYDYISHFMKS